MEIDVAAEDLGRRAVRWAIAGDRDEFLAAVGAIADAEPKVRDQVLPIYAAVGHAALRTIHQGNVPNQAQNQETAQDLLASEPWVPVGVPDVYEILESYSSPERAPQVAPERLAMAVFITDGYLLSRYTKGLGYQDFYAFLNDILNGLAAVGD